MIETKTDLTFDLRFPNFELWGAETSGLLYIQQGAFLTVSLTSNSEHFLYNLQLYGQGSDLMTLIKLSRCEESRSSRVMGQYADQLSRYRMARHKQEQFLKGKSD